MLVPVMAQAAGVLVDDVFEMRQAILDAEQLVHLLLVLCHREACLRVIEHELHLFGDRVLIDRHRHRAERLGGQHRPVELRPVVADDGDLVAAPHAERGKAAGGSLYSGCRFTPAVGLPDPEFLLAHRWPVATQFCVLKHELRKCVVGRGLGGFAGRGSGRADEAAAFRAANDDVANASASLKSLFRSAARIG